MTSIDPQTPASDLMRSLTDTVGVLLHQELRKAQEEMTDKARQAVKGVGILSGAAVLGALAAGTSATFVVRLLDGIMPPRAAAAFTTATFGAAATGLATWGIRELRSLQPPVPTQTMQSMRDDIDAAHREAHR